MFVGVGEFSPGSMGVIRDRPTKMERFKEWCQIAEFCIHYDVPCYTHEFTSYCMEEHLTMIANVCTKYPEFKVIIAHGGGSAEDDIKKACSLARNFENIYLETGYWRAEYYEYALMDPDLGASKLLWGGGDTGSHIWYPMIRRALCAQNAILCITTATTGFGLAASQPIISLISSAGQHTRSTV